MSDIPDYLIQWGAVKVTNAQHEFQKLINEFAGENIIQQITAANKTQLIGDAVKEVIYWGTTGSLWEAYKATEKIKLTEEMAPFLTEEKKQKFKNRLIDIISNL
jgi:hypothetical protein